MSTIATAFVLTYILFSAQLTTCSTECTRSRFEIEGQAADVRISGENVRVLCKGAVKKSTKLRFLYLDSNGIEKIEPGAFGSLPNLYDLHLSFNHLKEIASGVFNGLNIRFLYLNDNEIDTIHEEAFDNLTYLAFLNLEQNKLKKINPRWFAKTPRIYSVLYNSNQIVEIPDGAYMNFVKDVEVPIYLMNNSIEKIEPSAFEGPTKFGDVYLSNNRLKEINDSFISAEYVKNVYLDYNELECLSGGFKMAAVLGSVSVEGNPMRCECLLDIEYWTQIYNITLIVNPDRLNRCGYVV